MLPTGKYVPPSQRKTTPSPPSHRSPSPTPGPSGFQRLPSPTTSSSPVQVSSPPPEFAVQEQGPSPYAESYLKTEETRPKHLFAPLWPATVTGTTFGSYKLSEMRKGFVILRTRLLGAGSFGSVYRGYKADKTGKRTLYAIKVIKRSFQGTSGRGGQTDKALLNEINNWVHCNGNPYVVNLIDHYAVQQDYNFVMEFAPHGDLTSEVQKGKRGRLNDLEARYFFKQMVAGINYLHARGIAHRDVKLDNYLLFDHPKDPTMKIAKVIDFGLSTVCWTIVGGPIYGSNNCGTVRYMPPEVLIQRFGNPWPLKNKMLPNLDETAPTEHPPPEHPNWMQRQLGARTLRPPSLVPKVRDFQKANLFAANNDTWSLGVCLFNMTTGTYPFFVGDLPHGLDLIMKAKFTKYRYMATTTREFIRTMLEPDPAKRATCRNIMFHDWMFLNTPSRKGRQSKEPDLSMYVRPPYPVKRGSSAAWSAAAPGGPVPAGGPVAAAAAAAPVPVPVVAVTPKAPTPGSSALFPATPPALAVKGQGRHRAGAIVTPSSPLQPPARGRAGAIITQPAFTSPGSPPPPPARSPSPSPAPQGPVVVPGDVAPSQSSGGLQSQQTGSGAGGRAASPQPPRAKFFVQSSSGSSSGSNSP